MRARQGRQGPRETERLALLNVVSFDRMLWADFSRIEAPRTSSGDPGKFLWRPNGAEWNPSGVVCSAGAEGRVVSSNDGDER